MFRCAVAPSLRHRDPDMRDSEGTLGFDMGISLGIGLTNACDLDCAHCYRPQGGVQHLDLADVERGLAAFDVSSVHLGTGENILNPALPDVLDALYEHGISTTLSSNGKSLLELDSGRLRRLHGVEVSINFPDRPGLDAFRGEGTMARATEAVRRCGDLNLDVTVVAVMMRTNWDLLADIAELARSMGASFRVNVFQPVHESDLMPSWQQFWDGFRLLFERSALVTCSEPVVLAALGLEREGGCGCGRTGVRLTPAGAVLPCGYWPTPATRLADLKPDSEAELLASPEFVACRTVPEACVSCEFVATCGGGCPARRRLLGALDEPDPYCPLKGEVPVSLSASPGPHLDLLRGTSVCTTIVEAG